MAETDTLTQSVRITAILIDDPNNGRAYIDPKRVAQLADALAHEPLLHPITLRHTATGLHLIAGRHRLAAFQKLGRTEIPARILDVDNNTSATLRLSENLVRVQLSPVEQAKQLGELIAIDDQGVEAVATRLGRSVDWILDRLEILTWPETLISYVHTKRITLAAATILARIQPELTRAQRIEDAANHGCSAATARLWLQHQHADQPIENHPSVFLSQNPQFETSSQVRALCAGCTNLVPIEETELQRWCVNCLTEIREAQQKPREISPCLTPPRYDPGPLITQPIS